MRIIGVVGWSGSGKTTLVEKLIPRLVARGLSVSTMKHAHHGFDLDRPGKDSFRHRAAGASETMILSGTRWALMREIKNGVEPTMEALIERMTPVDLLIVEGFKSHAYDKIEVHRPSLGKELRAGGDRDIVAVASDVKLGGLPVPLLDLNDGDAVTAFVLERCGFTLAAAKP
jgi:molybdopterin-guanine dinucleotide biosynthesis adapter protein